MKKIIALLFMSTPIFAGVHLQNGDSVTASSVTASNLTSGQCVQAGTNGALTTTGSACGAGGGGGSSSSTGTITSVLTDLRAVITSSTVVNISSGISRIGTSVYSHSYATATLSGSADSSTAYIYVDSAGSLTFGHNGATTLTCSGCTTATSISAFPTSSIPIASALYSSGVWVSTGIIDYRTVVSRSILAAGTGISVTEEASGVQTIAATGSSGSTIGYGAFSSRPSCSASTQLYISTDSPNLSSICSGSAWTDYFANAKVTLPPAATSFTNVISSVSSSAGAVLLTRAATGLGVSLLAIPDTGASWDIKMALSPHGMWAGNATSFAECGLWITNGTQAATSNASGFVIGVNYTSNPQVLILRRSYSPINGSITDAGLVGMSSFASRPVWLRVTRSAGNVTAYVGDGVNWVAVQTIAPGFTATHYGIGCDPRGSDQVDVRVVGLTIE